MELMLRWFRNRWMLCPGCVHPQGTGPQQADSETSPTPLGKTKSQSCVGTAVAAAVGSDPPSKGHCHQHPLCKVLTSQAQTPSPHQHFHTELVIWQQPLRASYEIPTTDPKKGTKRNNSRQVRDASMKCSMRAHHDSSAGLLLLT